MVNGHRLSVFSLRATAKTNVVLSSTHVQRFLSHGRNAELKANSSLSIKIGFAVPDRVRRKFVTVVVHTKADEPATLKLWGAQSERMAKRAARTALRRIQLCCFDKSTDLRVTGLTFYNLCAKYVPPAKDIRLNMERLKQRHAFAFDPELNGPPAARRKLQEGGRELATAAVFANGTITLMGCSSVSDLKAAFALLQPIVTRCRSGRIEMSLFR